MKIGDAVKFIGFETHRPAGAPNGVGDWVGIVLRVYRISRIHASMRANVLWPDGKIGVGLFEETLEVISESG